jgi:hypothetical protein
MEVPLEEQGNKVRVAATLDKDIADHSCVQLASTGAPGPGASDNTAAHHTAAARRIPAVQRQCEVEDSWYGAVWDPWQR